MRVFRAVEADIPDLRQFILDAWRTVGPSAWGWTGATEEAIERISSNEYLNSMVSDAGKDLLVAREHNKIVGFAIDRKIDEKTVELAGMIVEEASTGKGVGSALLANAKAAACERGYNTMVVKTEAFNRRAISFYKSRGFVETGKGEENVEGTKVRLVILGLSLR